MSLFAAVVLYTLHCKLEKDKLVPGRIARSLIVITVALITTYFDIWMGTISMSYRTFMKSNAKQKI